MKALGNKFIAKAIIPGHENLKVDFIEEATTQELALDQIKNVIDKYLAEHQKDTFNTDIL